MQIEDLIAAKVRMAEVDAVVGMWVGSVLLLIAAALIAFGVYKSRQDYHSEAPLLCWLFGGFLALFGGLALPLGIYNYKTAELQARANLANYQLVELKK